MKKVWMLAISALLILSLAAPALAHGHKSSHGAKKQQYKVCTTVNCTLTGAHKHNGVWHSGEVCERDTYRLCTVKKCELTGPHQHEKRWYCTEECQITDYDQCTVKNCTRSGLHEHKDLFYRAKHNSAHNRGCCR